jgi:hypothetical protein
LFRTVSLGVAAFVVATTASAASSMMADDSFAGIPPQDLPLILKHVSVKFDASALTLFAYLKSVNHGYCGYVNATLEYDGYVPFFFDPETSHVELGHPDKLPESPTEDKLAACH